MTTGPVARGASGDRDAGFGLAGHGRVVVAGASALADVAVQPNGGIIAIGDDVSHAGIVLRLRPDGTRDARFGTRILTALGYVNGVAIDGKSRIVIAGEVPDATGKLDIAVWRLLPSGALDTSFGTGGLATYGSATDFDDVYDVAVDGADRVLVAGSANVADDALLVRFTSDGIPDPTFNSVGGNGDPSFRLHGDTASFQGIAVQPDGKVVLTGEDLLLKGLPVYRLIPGDATATGTATLDPGFAGDGRAEIHGLMPDGTAVSLQSGGGILVAGETTTSHRPALARLTSHGALDPRYGNRGKVVFPIKGSLTATLLDVTAAPDGGAAVVGHNGYTVSFVARVNAHGVLDPAMGPDGIRRLRPYDFARAGVSLQPDGRILVAGTIQRRSDGNAVGGFVYRFLGGLKVPSCHGRKATIVGTAYNDHLRGTRRADVIAGWAGRDHISGLGRDDVVCGGGGADVLRGGRGDDILIGGPGQDVLKGGPGHDRLRQ